MNSDKIENLKLQFFNKEITSFFDCLSDILLKLTDKKLHTFPDFKKTFSKVMLCRYISMKPSLFKYSEILNKYQLILTNEQFYILAYELIPKQKCGYISYLKKQKKDKNKINNKKDNSFISSSLFELFK